MYSALRPRRSEVLIIEVILSGLRSQSAQPKSNHSMQNIPYGRQSINEADLLAVEQVLKSDFLTQGPAVAEFERSFSEYVEATHAIAVSNGTTALHLCCLALGLKPGDKVIVTPITFAASVNCVRYCGAEPIFVDIDPDTALLDQNKVRECLASPQGKGVVGIIPVDFAGAPVDLEELRGIADEFGCWIIEDACHAPGGSFNDSSGHKNPCGNGRYADAAIFSFHPVKHIACGEGGMVTTKSDKVAEKVRLLRTHGITKDPDTLEENHGGWYYEMHELGYNYRLSDMQAALGHSQLSRAKAGIARRREIAKRYEAAFADLNLDLLQGAANQDHAFHLFIVHLENRADIYQQLRSKHIYSQVHYIPVHTMPYYKQLAEYSLPCAETYYEGCLSLPMYHGLTDDDQARVIEVMTELCS